MSPIGPIWQKHTSLSEVRESLGNVDWNATGRIGLMWDYVEVDLREGKPRLVHDGQTVIACVASPISVWLPDRPDSNADLKPEQQRDDCSIFERTRAFDYQKWEDRRAAELTQALSFDPDFVCFPEFAYPPPPALKTAGISTQTIHEAGGQRMQFEKRMLEILARKDSDAFVFLGSYHCPITLYNVGVIYPRGQNTKSVPAVRVSRRPADAKRARTSYKLIPPIIYLKRFPARGRGELTRVPPRNQFHTYELPFGRVGVLICSDILDINQLKTLMEENLAGIKYGAISMILVPSFNLSHLHNAMCRELSFVAATTVVIVNACFDHWRDLSQKKRDEIRTNAFCCGYSAAELSAGAIPALDPSWIEGIKLEPTKPISDVSHAGDSHVFKVTLDHRKLNKMRNELHASLLALKPKSGAVNRIV